MDGAFYFNAGPGTRKARNLANDHRCVITVATHPFDLVVEGEAVKVTDDAELRWIADVFAAEGWVHRARRCSVRRVQRAQRRPAAWHVYEVTPTTVFALGTAEPYGATRFRF